MAGGGWPDRPIAVVEEGGAGGEVLLSRFLPLGLLVAVRVSVLMGSASATKDGGPCTFSSGRQGRNWWPWRQPIPTKWESTVLVWYWDWNLHYLYGKQKRELDATIISKAVKTSESETVRWSWDSSVW
jgi:hypothetical protein